MESESININTHQSNNTSLTVAIERNFPNTVSFLLEKGASVNFLDGLSLKIAVDYKNITISRTLLEDGAIIDVLTFEMVINKLNIGLVQLFIEFGAPSIQIQDDDHPEIKIMLESVTREEKLLKNPIPNEIIKLREDYLCSQNFLACARKGAIDLEKLLVNREDNQLSSDFLSSIDTIVKSQLISSIIKTQAIFQIPQE